MNKNNFKKTKLPDKPGVYFFMKKKTILYIGKATSLKDRVNSYFSKDLISTRGPMIVDMLTIADDIKYQETDSVLEALILEANLIKKYKPKYNTKEKDDKSFNYVVITKDSTPKVLIVRGKNLEEDKYQSIYGPFTNGNQLKEAMKIIRPIFPYFDDDSLRRSNREFYKQVGLVPDEAKNNIKNLKLFFQGKKKSVIISLKKQMMSLAKDKKFEKANEAKKKIFALEHINDVALIKGDTLSSPQISDFRIEAYDVAHMSGKNMVGVMTVIENSQINKSEYRKFIIKTQNKANDIGALEEILTRRIKHGEWKFPNLIVVDGGVAQLNKAQNLVKNLQKNSFQKVLGRGGRKPDHFKKNLFEDFSVYIVSVLKNDKHKPKAILGDKMLIKKYKREILLANSEAHRFAISFHKNQRNKNFIV